MISTGADNVTALDIKLDAFYSIYIPDHEIQISVSDGEDISYANISIHIINTNDPPGKPNIVTPEEGDSFKKGKDVDLVVSCTDPDLVEGQVLTIIISSSLGGELSRSEYEPGDPVILSGLKAGKHIINVTVSDGEFENSTELEIRILRPEKSSPFLNPIGILISILSMAIIAQRFQKR
jgi:hypothetical protein